jgi:hypothetical protein
LLELSSVSARISVSGASKLDLRATDVISGSASGASTVQHAGTAEVNVSASGVASVEVIP